MSTGIESLLSRTLDFVQQVGGDIVGGAIEKAKKALVKNLVSMAVGAAAVVLAVVYASISFHRWLDTIVDANHRYAPPLIVALVCGAVGFGVLHSFKDRR